MLRFSLFVLVALFLSANASNKCSAAVLASCRNYCNAHRFHDRINTCCEKIQEQGTGDCGHWYGPCELGCCARAAKLMNAGWQQTSAVVDSVRKLFTNHVLWRCPNHYTYAQKGCGWFGLGCNWKAAHGVCKALGGGSQLAVLYDSVASMAALEAKAKGFRHWIGLAAGGEINAAQGGHYPANELYFVNGQQCKNCANMWFWQPGQPTVAHGNRCAYMRFWASNNDLDDFMKTRNCGKWFQHWAMCETPHKIHVADLPGGDVLIPDGPAIVEDPDHEIKQDPVDDEPIDEVWPESDPLNPVFTVNSNTLLAFALIIANIAAVAVLISCCRRSRPTANHAQLKYIDSEIDECEAEALQS